VIDVGCGRGQFGLLLHDLGRVDSLFGFDWDPAKIATARAAADGCAQFVTADLRSPPMQPADTILVFDVLQYLSTDEQIDLLKSLADALRPGGRMLIRCADRGRGWQAKFSQMLERCGRALGVNRSHILTFRPSEELKATLESLGLRVRCAERGRSALLDNRLWIAELTREH
jgi:SAM-dependent methyltransferase